MPPCLVRIVTGRSMRIPPVARTARIICRRPKPLHPQALVDRHRRRRVPVPCLPLDHRAIRTSAETSGTHSVGRIGDPAGIPRPDRPIRPARNWHSYFFASPKHCTKSLNTRPTWPARAWQQPGTTVSFRRPGPVLGAGSEPGRRPPRPGEETYTIDGHEHDYCCSIG